MSLRRHRDYDRSAFGLHTHGPFTHPTLSAGIKVFIALSDTAAGQSCTAVVPGTFRQMQTPADIGLDFVARRDLYE